MKRIAVFILLASGIYLLANRKSDLDNLMIPVTNFTEAQVGNRFVEIDQANLPTTPDRFAEPGVITVVYFHDDTCPGCSQLDRNLDDFLRVRPDVAVRKIRISLDGDDAYYKAIKNYRWKIFAVPCILLFGKSGTLIAADERINGAGQDLLEEWIGKELEKAANAKNALGEVIPES